MMMAAEAIRLADTLLGMHPGDWLLPFRNTGFRAYHYKVASSHRLPRSRSVTDTLHCVLFPCREFHADGVSVTYRLFRFWRSDMSAACVKVIHGANDGVFDLAGATVASVRRSLVDAFNVPEDALAFVNGEQVDLSSFRLVGQETLEFCQQAGIKGAGKKKNLTEEDLNRLGLAVVGNEAIPIEDAYPDESWEATRLEAYAKAKLAGSSLAEERAILESHKIGRASCRERV